MEWERGGYVARGFTKKIAKFSGRTTTGSHRSRAFVSKWLLTYWVRPFGQRGTVAVTGHNRSVTIFPQSRPSRSVSGAFRFKAILALPALSRRPEDHRRHRRACGDCQGYSRTWACLCAPPRSPARPLALFQAGLILKAKAVLQCPDDPTRPALACSGQTVSKRFGPIQGSNNHREREIFTKHRAIDR